MDLDGLLVQDTRYSSLVSIVPLVPFGIGERSFWMGFEWLSGCSYCSLRAVIRFFALNPEDGVTDSKPVTIAGGSNFLDGSSLLGAGSNFLGGSNLLDGSDLFGGSRLFGGSGLFGSSSLLGSSGLFGGSGLFDASNGWNFRD